MAVLTTDRVQVQRMSTVSARRPSGAEEGEAALCRGRRGGGLPPRASKGTRPGSKLDRGAERIRGERSSPPCARRPSGAEEGEAALCRGRRGGGLPPPPVKNAGGLPSPTSNQEPSGLFRRRPPRLRRLRRRGPSPMPAPGASRLPASLRGPSRRGSPLAPRLEPLALEILERSRVEGGPPVVIDREAVARLLGRRTRRVLPPFRHGLEGDSA